MIRPLELPADAPELARKRAAEWALGLVDVAAMFGITKQSVYDWARGGRIAPDGKRLVLPSLRAPGSKQEPLRFRLADVQDFANAQYLTFDVTLLELPLQRRLGVGIFAAPDGALLDRATVADELVSEVVAADELGISRSRLQKLRAKGRLNPAIRVEGSKYSLLDVWRVAEGALELELPDGVVVDELDPQTMMDEAYDAVVRGDEPE
jgi:hypothetical protein